MEACGGAHHWARLLRSKGYVVKLIAPQFVKPYVKSNKNDANDAQAICEATPATATPRVPPGPRQSSTLHARAQALTRCGADWAPVVPRCQKVPVDASDRDLGARRSGAYLSRATAVPC